MSKEIKNKKALQPIYKQLSELIGEEAMLKVWEEFKGIQITLPAHLYNRDSVKQAVVKEFDGSNSGELARKYGYNQKWIRDVVTGRLDK